jgi:hypothetical protein
MRLLHFVQPRRGPRPAWNCADQRSDAPLAAIARIAQGADRIHDATVVFGGAAAVSDACMFGLNTIAHAPVCGWSRLGLRRLRNLDHRRTSTDVLIGWGSQFREVFDRLMPRSNAIVIDLADGTTTVRSLMQSAWHTLPAMPARLGCDTPQYAHAFQSEPRAPRVAIGLCRDGPKIEPIASFTFAMGGVAVSGFEVDAVVTPDVNDLSRLLRHTREGGRLRTVQLLQRPLALSGTAADLWIYAITPKSGLASSSDSTDWASMLTADSLCAQGFNVVAALPDCSFIPPSVAPRTMFVQTHALSDVSGAIRNWLIGRPMSRLAFENTDLPTTLLHLAARISAKEPIFETSASGQTTDA